MEFYAFCVILCSNVLNLYVAVLTMSVYTRNRQRCYSDICACYLIVVCIDGKKYITENDPQPNTEISVDILFGIGH
jgi:hypothetical protein